MADPAWYEEAALRCGWGRGGGGARPGRPHPDARQRRAVPYDRLVLATGSVPFVPHPRPSAGGLLRLPHPGDLAAIRDAPAPRPRSGVVIGGGPLGLEAANALRLLGLKTQVVEFRPRLMPVQLDESGGAVLRDKIQAWGRGAGGEGHRSASSRGAGSPPPAFQGRHSS